MTGDQDQADPLTRIRHACQDIKAALRDIDQANANATLITDRMRGTLEVLSIDLTELKHFRPK